MEDKPILINSFKEIRGGEFIAPFPMYFKIYKYANEEQMQKHKQEMIADDYNATNGEVKKYGNLIKRKLVVTYTKVGD